MSRLDRVDEGRRWWPPEDVGDGGEAGRTAVCGGTRNEDAAWVTVVAEPMQGSEVRGIADMEAAVAQSCLLWHALAKVFCWRRLGTMGPRQRGQSAVVRRSAACIRG